MDGLERKEIPMRELEERCAVCGGPLVEKEVEKLLKGGSHMASCQATADVCLHCGERFYSPETIARFEKIELKLEQNETQEFQPLGNAFQIAS